jgi:hypothetical protein
MRPNSGDPFILKGRCVDLIVAINGKKAVGASFTL